MALRVLLADESSTIKKVMQLALQDFAVEVKSVPVGLDVLAVTKTYKPDIIFADVLLTKRNGYEVCSDLKSDPETNPIPVVLMWSGFMDIDEAKATEARADRRLEKPFDAEILRKLVKDLVQKTRSHPLSEYLTFPPMPEFEERPAAVSESSSSPSITHALETNELGNNQDLEASPLGEIYSIPEEDTGSHVLSGGHSTSERGEDFDMPAGEEFSRVSLTAAPKLAAMTSARENEGLQDEGGWSHQDLSQFKIKIPADEALENEDFASKFVIPAADLSQPHVEVSGDFEELSFEKAPAPQKPAPGVPNQTVKQAMPPQAPAARTNSPEDHDLTSTKIRQEGVKTQTRVDSQADLMEKVIREQAREVIEAICWKILPDIAERIVREEIQKILRENEKSI